MKYQKLGIISPPIFPTHYFDPDQGNLLEQTAVSLHMQIQTVYTSPKLYQFHCVSIYYSSAAHKFALLFQVQHCENDHDWACECLFIEPLFIQVIHLKRNVSFMKETCYHRYHTS